MSSPATFAWPRLSPAWAPAASGHLFGVLASWRARRRPGAVWRSRSVGTPRRGPRGREEEQRRAGRTAPRAGGRRRRRAGRPGGLRRCPSGRLVHRAAMRIAARGAGLGLGPALGRARPPPAHLLASCGARPTQGRPTHAPRGSTEVPSLPL